MTSKKKSEWISTAEACKRLDTTKPILGGHKKTGAIDQVRKTPKGVLEWKWPEVQTQYEAAQKVKREKIAANMGRPKFDINAREYQDLSAHEKVIAAIEMGAKNAPDLAYLYEKAIEQTVKTRLASIKLLDAEGRTLTKEEVENFIFTASRNNRDKWLHWPELVSTRMAEELGITPKKCHDVLRKYVRQQLERNSQLPISFDGTVDNTVPERTETA